MKEVIIINTNETFWVVKRKGLFCLLKFHDCVMQFCSKLGPEGEGHVQYKMIPLQEGSMELCMHENHVLFLPVNILTVWHASFLDCMAHYHVS